MRVKAESLAHKTFTGVIPRRDLVAFGNAARSRGHYQYNQVRVVGGVVHIDSCQLNFHNTRVLLVQLAQLLKEAGACLGRRRTPIGGLLQQACSRRLRNLLGRRWSLSLSGGHAISYLVTWKEGPSHGVV